MLGSVRIGDQPVRHGGRVAVRVRRIAPLTKARIDEVAYISPGANPSTNVNVGSTSKFQRIAPGEIVWPAIGV